jgi:hypothetical protein
LDLSRRWHGSVIIRPVLRHVEWAALSLVIACSAGSSKEPDFPGDYLGDKTVLKIRTADGGLSMDLYHLPATDTEAQLGSLYQLERRDQRVVAAGPQGAASFSASRTAEGLDAVIEGRRESLRRTDLTVSPLSSEAVEKLARDSLSKVLAEIQADGRCTKGSGAPTPASQRVVEQLSHVLENAAMIHRVTRTEGLLVDRYESHGHLMVPGGKGSQPGDVPFAFTAHVPRSPLVPAPEPAVEWTRLGERLTVGLDGRAVCALRAPNWLNVTGSEPR